MSPTDIPNIAVSDQNGNLTRFGSGLLKSDAAIISFIYTTCKGTCPLVGANFARIDKLLETSKETVRIILVSSDPETDSPPRLKTWADRFGSPSTWTLVNGSLEDVNRLSIALTGSPVAGPRHHVPRAIIGSQASGSWTHAYALDEPASILEEVNRVGKDPPVSPSSEASFVQGAALGQSPAATGSWSGVIDLGIVAVHMVLLPSGNILLWPRYNNTGIFIPTGALGSQSPHIRIWDPLTESFLPAPPNPYTNLFCSGHTQLSDGRILVIGGHSRTAGNSPDQGVFDASIASGFDAGTTIRWLRASAMQFERWYPTVLALPGGKALAIGGSYSKQGPRENSLNQPAEVGSPGARGWTGFNHHVGGADVRASQVAAVRGGGGLADVFIVEDNRIWHSPQRPDGTFPEFSERPVGVPENRTLRMAVVKLRNGRLDVYMVGLDNQIWHSVQNLDGTFPDFARARVGVLANRALDVAVARRGDADGGGVEVFMIGLDNRMWHSPQQANGTFPDFAERPIGTSANRAHRLAVVLLQDGRFDAYMVGLDNQIWHSVQNPDGTFPDFAHSRVGSPADLGLDISVARRSDDEGGGVDVFMVGLDNRMWHSLQGRDGSFPDFAGAPIAPPTDGGISVSALAGAHEVYIARVGDQTIGQCKLNNVFAWRTVPGTERTTSNDTGWYIYYPWAYLAPNGQIFIPGPTRKSFWLDIAGGGSLRLGPQSSVFRDYGSVAMYDSGKILIVGGGTTASNTAEASAEFIDLNSPTPAWQTAPPMANPRKHANATVLPDGTVLVTGGTRIGGDPSAEGENFAVLEAELWNPRTNSWSTMGNAATPRLYHSTALLLPNGKVLVAGGGQGGGPDSAKLHLDGVIDRPTAELFSPPYLHMADGTLAKRPVIGSIPSKLHHRTQFTVGHSDGMVIVDVTLISLGSVTHSYNENQRLCRLKFVDHHSSLTVTAPPGENVCPSGYYMLFILNTNGVPSEGKIVHVSP